jgi:acetylornithine aminotransferase
LPDYLPPKKQHKLNLFDVYPIQDIEPVRAQGSHLWDTKGQQYLDLYGGHAVISIGHCHPHYVQTMTEQLQRINFYSNSVKISLQDQLAELLGRLSGCADYSLFLCNSGAEANENALKLASFYNGRSKVVAFTKAFHGRTAGAVAVTDNASIVAPVNYKDHVTFLPFNDVAAANQYVTDDTCAVIVEGIQGVGGIQVANEAFLRAIRQRCNETGAVFILDSVQCGYGRSGRFFSDQHYDNLQADVYTTAKGMGNGFPIGGVLISPKFKAKHGMLGTTFGGNHLACAAAIAVLEVIEQEKLIANAEQVGNYILSELKTMGGYKDLRGRGLMIGIEYDFAVEELRNKLLFEDHIFTGVAGKNTIRLLPSLALTQVDADVFLSALQKRTR